MKKLLLIFIFGIFLISLASATIDLGSFKQGECVELKQTCDTCTYVNISSISRTGANATTWNINGEMTKSNVDYNYTFCDTNIAGEYTYSVYGDKDSLFKSETGYFTITPSGNKGNEVYIIIILFLAWGLGFGGFFGKHEIITLFGSLLMIGLGLYFVINGITIYRDWITNFISYISIGLGAYFGFMASYSLYEDM